MMIHRYSLMGRWDVGRCVTVQNTLMSQSEISQSTKEP